MRIRLILTLTAVVSSILGAVAVYLALSVPNDLRADAMLKKARTEISAGRTEPGRDELSRIIQQYPRTDAAAAATIALVKLSEQENEKLRLELSRLQQDVQRHSQQLSGLGQSLESIKNAPPKTVTVQAPAKKTTPKRTPAKKRAPTRTRRRR